jgi:dTDP-4-amino-4,6-dideoxygalactose transaminase
MQSAIGRVLLYKLPNLVNKRRQLASILTRRFSSMPALRVTTPPEGIYHSYYKYYAFLRSETLREGWNQQRVIEAIHAEGIPCFWGSCSEIYLEKAFTQPMRPSSRLPVAKELGETALMFLVHPTLSETDMDDVADGVQKVLTVATQA